MGELPIIPPVCPTCRVACLWESSTPAVGSGVVMERHYCPVCGWNPAVDELDTLLGVPGPPPKEDDDDHDKPDDD